MWAILCVGRLWEVWVRYLQSIGPSEPLQRVPFGHTSAPHSSLCLGPAKAPPRKSSLNGIVFRFDIYHSSHFPAFFVVFFLFPSPSCPLQAIPLFSPFPTASDLRSKIA